MSTHYRPQAWIDDGCLAAALEEIENQIAQSRHRQFVDIIVQDTPCLGAIAPARMFECARLAKEGILNLSWPHIRAIGKRPWHDQSRGDSGDAREQAFERWTS